MDAAVLYTRIRTRLDLEPSEYISDLENGELVQEATFELWDILCSSLGDEMPWERVTYATVANQDYIDIDIDQGAYRIVRVDTHLSGSDQWLPMYPGVIGSDPIGVAPNGWHTSEALTYYAQRRPRGTDAQRGGTARYSAWKFYFDPTPRAVHDVRIWFVKAPAIVMGTGLESPAIPVGTAVSFPDDYPEFIVARVCSQLAVKQEADPGPFMVEAERIKAHIERLNKPHNLTAPRLMVDARQHQIERDNSTHPFLRRS